MFKRFKPVDRLTFVYILLNAVVTVAFLPKIPHWKWLIARYAAVALALVLVARFAAGPRSKKPLLYLHAFMPALIVPVMFDAMGDLIPWIWPRYFDDALIRIDFALFGVHPTVWLERFIHPAATTILQFAYISYYPMAIVLGAALLLKHKRDEFDDALFGIVLCFYLSYIGYLLVPAVGPRFTLAHVQTMDLQAGPLVQAIQEALNRLENTKTDAFPSGHTAIALITVYYAWKTRERVLALLLAPVVIGLIVSTVYLRYHYVIDVIAGVGLTILTIYCAPRLSRVMLRASGKARKQLHGAP